MNLYLLNANPSATEFDKLNIVGLSVQTNVFHA